MKAPTLFIWLIVALLAVPAGLRSQVKTLTLEESILGQRSTLAPESIPNLQWIKGSPFYSFTDKGGKSLYKGEAQYGVSEKVISMEEIHAWPGVKDSVTSLAGIIWLDPTRFLSWNQNTLMQTNLVTRTNKPVYTLMKELENRDLHPETMNCAFTLQNNLYIATGNNDILSVTRNTDPGIVSGQSIARNEFGISKGTFWSPSGKSLAFYQKDENPVSNYPLEDISTTPSRLKSIKYPMAGQENEKEKVGVFHLASRKLLYLETGTEDQFLTNLSWSPDEKFIFLAIVNRSQNRMNFNQYDAVSGKFVKTLFSESNDKYVEPEHPALFLPGKPDQFLWISERDGFDNIYRYNIQGELLTQLTKNKFVVKEILGFTKDGGSVLYSTTGESPLNTLYYLLDLASGTSQLLTPEPGTHRALWNESEGYLLDTWSNLNTPLMIEIRDVQGKLVRTVKSSPDPFAAYAIGYPEIFPINASDGTPLYARMIRPSSFDAKKKYPVLVYVYGGPHRQLNINAWMGGAPYWMLYLAEQGYLVFTLDNRGSDYRGFKFESATFRNLGTLELEDQMKGVEYLKSLPYVDTSRMAVHGWSYGGFMTASMMLRQPGIWKVGVAGGPVTDWKYYEIMYGERYMDKPQENPEGYQKASLHSHIKNLKGNLLLIHGSVDDTVVPQHSLSLIKKAVDEGVQLDFFIYPMHPHNVLGKDRVHLMRKVIDYIQLHLQP